MLRAQLARRGWRYSSGGGGGGGGGDESGSGALRVSVAACFACLAVLQGKRLYEERTGNDYGLSALLNGRWGEPAVLRRPRGPDA